MVSIVGGGVVCAFLSNGKPVDYIWVKAEGRQREMLGAVAVVCSKERAGLRDEGI
jgi:hypothetical protein